MSRAFSGEGAIGREVISGCGFFPTLFLCNVVNVFWTVNFNVAFHFIEINAVAVFCRTNTLEGWGSFFVDHEFGNGFKLMRTVCPSNIV